MGRVLRYLSPTETSMRWSADAAEMRDLQEWCEGGIDMISLRL